MPWILSAYPSRRSMPLALGSLPFATMVMALVYELMKGTMRSITLSVALFLFVIAGLVVELEGSQVALHAVCMSTFLSTLSLNMVHVVVDYAHGAVSQHRIRGMDSH